MATLPALEKRGRFTIGLADLTPSSWRLKVLSTFGNTTSSVVTAPSFELDKQLQPGQVPIAEEDDEVAFANQEVEPKDGGTIHATDVEVTSTELNTASPTSIKRPVMLPASCVVRRDIRHDEDVFTSDVVPPNSGEESTPPAPRSHRHLTLRRRRLDQSSSQGGSPDSNSPVSDGMSPSTNRSRLDEQTLVALFRQPGQAQSALEHQECAIRFESFADGEYLRTLPCMHRYHVACVDEWLAESCACPMCKYEIV
jgi:hypothetical protein